MLKILVMNERKEEDTQRSQSATTDDGKQQVKNPFEDGLSAEQDIEQAGEQLEKEQEFKEAQSERD